MSDSRRIYIRGDGNGGISVSVPLVLITAIIAVLATAVPIVMAYGALNEKVQNLEKNYESGMNKDNGVITNIEARLIALEKIAAATEVSLSEIQKDIDEIKLDVKEAKNDLKIYEGGLQ
jgi:peptidoglycan hydrolase CwlO-like protein